MITEEIKLPVYAKVTIILLGFIAVFTVLYIAGDIIVPGCIFNNPGNCTPSGC